MTKDICQMGIIDMLAYVMGEEFPIGDAPDNKLKTGRKKIGVVSSLVARKLYTAEVIVMSAIRSQKDEHAELHEGRCNLINPDCQEFQARLVNLTYRRRILHSLFSHAITEEHPILAVNDCEICRRWVITNEDSPFSDVILFPDKSARINNFIATLRLIVSGKYTNVDEGELSVAASDEVLIGTLCDKRVQTLFTIWNRMSGDWNDVFKDRYPNPDQADQEEMRKHHDQLEAYFERLSNIVSTIFWLGVRDNVPETEGLPYITLRRAWEIFKGVPKIQLVQLQPVTIPAD